MTSRRARFHVASLAALGAALTLAAGPARAAVVGLEIISRAPFADGASFGTVGPYEKIRGVLHYEVEVGNQANHAIVDLQLAPKSKGKVAFQGEFVMLKPVDLSKGNHRLLSEVNNRGGLRMLGYYNDAVDSNDPATATHAGNGFLMRQGYTLLWAAWNWDVTRGGGRMQISLPVASNGKNDITGYIDSETVLATLTTPNRCQPVAWGNSIGYEPANPTDPNAVLTWRMDPWAPDGERTTIPRGAWHFQVPMTDGSGSVGFCIDDAEGFVSGRIYELVYLAKQPRVMGLGLAAIRDAISFFRFERADAAGVTNPLFENGAPDSRYGYLFGISQSGRVITHMLWQGFYVDEAGRMVVEGMIPHVAGGGKGGFNWRFAQTTHHPSHLEGLSTPVDFFPFTYSTETDPVSGETGSLLDWANKHGQVPKIVITNHESEYFMRAASLMQTDPTGSFDVELPSNVRYYMVNGAQHGTPASRTRPLYQYPGTTLDQRPVGRAALLALDAWVSAGLEPPASRYPRIDRGELVPVGQHKVLYPAIPDVRVLGTCEQAPRLDFGPRFFNGLGIQDYVPPAHVGDYVNLVPKPDADGNTLGGIRLPDVAAPLGTYAGWNPRKPAIGNPNYLARWDGSFFMFPLTDADRQPGDPRRSIAARYPDQQAYVSAVTQVAQELVANRYLLQEDADGMIARASRTAWPPQTWETYPFWVLQ